jgi:hypothetical protein
MIFGTTNVGRTSAVLLLPHLVAIFGAVMFSGGAWAGSELLFKGKPVHPACVYALVTQAEGDRLPVTLAVSLAGCASSARGALPVSEQDQAATITDEVLIGSGSFGYRALSRLDNGIFALAIRRIYADGKREVSLAAVELVESPMIRSGMVIQVPTIELLGLLPLPDSQFKSFRRAGNRVQVKVGTGPNAIDRVVDLSELGKARKKR